MVYREILQSEVMSNTQELTGGAPLPSINEEDAESEILLHFLLTLKEKKQKDSSKLVEELSCIETDIKEIERRQMKEFVPTSGNELLRRGHTSLDVYPKPLCDEKFIRHIRHLESAYFSMRSNVHLPENDVAIRNDGDLLRTRENRHLRKEKRKCTTDDRLGGFFGDLCKYARYSRFKVQGIVRAGDLTNTANVICSLSFDRDEDYLAAGGISKKIKIYEFHTLFDDSVDIHYPVVEMSNKSKLSCICWNGYIRNYLASTDYDGVVKVCISCTLLN